MDATPRPARFKTDDEFVAWRTAYQKAYREANRERRQRVLYGLEPKRRRDHEKKRQ